MAVLLLAACGDDTGVGGSRNDSLDGRTFVRATLTGHHLVKGSDIRLSFKDGNLSASAGCNNLGGSGRIDGRLVRRRHRRHHGDGLPEAADGPGHLALRLPWLGPGGDPRRPPLTLSKGDIKLALADEAHVRAQNPVPFDGTTWVLDSLISGIGDDGA